jgi:hypothetical protein
MAPVWVEWMIRKSIAGWQGGVENPGSSIETLQAAPAGRPAW